MTFNDFCENSKKLNRMIIVLGCFIIAGGISFACLSGDEIVLQVLDKWLPILTFIIGYLFKAEKDEPTDISTK